MASIRSGIGENMEDRYLYRANRKDNGEWIVGSLIQSPYLGSIRSWISSEQEDKARLREISSKQAVWRAFEVRIDTICQCTGLKDKNGNLIWENDIVKCVDVNAETEFFAVVEFGNTNGFYSCGYQLKHIYGDEPNLDILLWIDMEETGATCAVIGNIFDNPELLGRNYE